MGFVFGNVELLLKGFCGVTEVVAVDKTVTPGVIGRVYVDAFDALAVGFQEVFQPVQVVAGDVDVFALGIFGEAVVRFIGYDDGGGIGTGEELGIAFPEELQLVAFVYDIGMVFNFFLKAGDIKTAVCGEACREVFFQNGDLSGADGEVIIMVFYILYHRAGLWAVRCGMMGDSVLRHIAVNG